MSNHLDILENVSSLNNSINTRKDKTKINVKVWEKILHELFIFIINAERKSEKIRNSLIQRKDLMPSQLFSRIDLNRKGGIDANDLKKLLNDNSVNCKIFSLKNLIKFNMRNISSIYFLENPVLEYDDFLDYLLPKEESDTKNVYLISDYHFRKKNLSKLESSDFYISYEVELALVSLIQTEISNFEKIDNYIDKLLRYKDFKISYIADLLDNNYKDYINELDFCEYLIEKSKIFNEERDYNIKNSHEDARYIISHLAKFDTEKVKVYIEDLRLFFNVHNHPEIKIIGRNLPNNQRENLNKRTYCLLQDQNYNDDDIYNIDKLRNKENEKNRKWKITKNSKISKDKSNDSLNQSVENLSQTIDSVYFDNRKKELKQNVFHNSFYERDHETQKVKEKKMKNKDYNDYVYTENDSPIKLKRRNNENDNLYLNTEVEDRKNDKIPKSFYNLITNGKNISYKIQETESDLSILMHNKDKILATVNSSNKKNEKKKEIYSKGYRNFNEDENKKKLIPRSKSGAFIKISNEKTSHKNDYFENYSTRESEKNRKNSCSIQDINESYYQNENYKSTKGVYEKTDRGKFRTEKQMTLPKLMKMILEDLKELEKIRLDLSRNNEIVLIELFKLFDYGETGVIDKMNFYKTIKKFGLSLTKNEINLIFREYDLDFDGCFDFFEFSEIFLPKNAQDAKNMSSRIISRINQISNNSKLMLIDFFEKLADTEVKIQSYRMDFNKEYELSPYEQFMKLKSANSNNCDKNQMKNFLQKYDFVKSPLEIELIFTRFDKNKDGKFDFSEFLNEISVE